MTLAPSPSSPSGQSASWRKPFSASSSPKPAWEMGLALWGEEPAPAQSASRVPSLAFSEWLFTKARTEQGPFPDWQYLRDFARALETGQDIIVLKRRQILISWVTA